MEAEEQPPSRASWCFLERVRKVWGKLPSIRNWAEDLELSGSFCSPCGLFAVWVRGSKVCKGAFMCRCLLVEALSASFSLLCLLREKQAGRRGRIETGQEVEKVWTKSRRESSGFCSSKRKDTPVKRCPWNLGTSLQLEASRNQGANAPLNVGKIFILWWTPKEWCRFSASDRCSQSFKDLYSEWERSVLLGEQWQEDTGEGVVVVGLLLTRVNRVIVELIGANAHDSCSR